MASFLLIFTDGREPTEEESAGVLQDWTNWFSVLGENLVDAGNPITPGSKNISSDGSVKDGPVGVEATGYSIIKADTLAAAVAAAKSCPHLKSGGEITVYETFPVA